MPRKPWVPPPKSVVPVYRPPSGTRYFTHYWANDTWRWQREQEGEPLRHTAGNLFRSRGVGSGDFVYVVTVLEGRLFLAGRIEVQSIVGQQEASTALAEDRLWEASEHIIARPGTDNPQRYRRQVPAEVVKQLRFIEHTGPAVAPIVDSQGLLDRQTLRGVRELTPASAALLDRLIR